MKDFRGLLPWICMGMCFGLAILRLPSLGSLLLVLGSILIVPKDELEGLFVGCRSLTGSMTDRLRRLHATLPRPFKNQMVRGLLGALLILAGLVCAPSRPILPQRPEPTSPASSAHSAPDTDAPTLEEIEFHVRTSVLEYSLKETDPVGLLDFPQVDGLTVTTEDHLDLSRLGIQSIAYLAKLGNEEGAFDVEYTIRDTKPPDIKLQSDNVTITVGDAFDPASNVLSVTDSVDGPLQRLEEAPKKLSSDERGRTYEEGWYLITHEVDTTTPNTYFLTVEAHDNHDNVTTREFSVTVQPATSQPDPTEPAAPESTEATESAATPEPTEYTYIINTNSHKFHYPTCSSVDKMSEKNKETFTGTREDVIAQGYEPCGVCNP